MYEYKVVPAPVRATKAKGLKSTAERFSKALAECLNAEAAGGWQFQRTETLACEERSAMGRVKTTMQTVMVFARPIGTVRPDAGVAIAAAQVAESNYFDDEPAYEEPTYDEAQEFLEAQHFQEPAPEGPTPQPAKRPQPSRQEPLFSANPMSRRDVSTRPEPILRPRAPRIDEDED